MILEDTTIYPLIKACPELCELHRFDRNKYITRADWSSEDVWYLVSGRVKVETTAQNGNKLLVDIIDEDNYVGHLSNFRGHNFYCDSITTAPSTLLRIPADRFRSLLDTQAFSRHFYMKTSARLYDMYKRDLVRDLFSQRQQFAFYVLEKTQDGVCRIHSIYYICEYLKISRRNLYNLLARFSEENILEREDAGDIVVLDMASLCQIAKPVEDFFYNKI